MKYKAGDVLLFKPFERDTVGFLVSLFSNMGDYCHAAVYTGNNRIVEAKPKTGVSTRLLTNLDYEYIVPFYMPLLTNPEIYRLIRYLMLQVKDKVEYDTIGLIPAFFHSVLGGIFKNKEYQKAKGILNDTKKVFCSDLVGTSFYEVLSIEIHPTIYHTNITPNDLANSLLVRRK